MFCNNKKGPRLNLINVKEQYLLSRYMSLNKNQKGNGWNVTCYIQLVHKHSTQYAHQTDNQTINNKSINNKSKRTYKVR